jgi:hypothetical protein
MLKLRPILKFASNHVCVHNTTTSTSSSTTYYTLLPMTSNNNISRELLQRPYLKLMRLEKPIGMF